MATTTVRALRARQARRLAARRAEGATTALERMNAAVHLTGRCGEPDCAPEPGSPWAEPTHAINDQPDNGGTP